MSMETVGSEQSREKMKKDKKKRKAETEGPDTPSTSHISSNPMEKKKQKRAVDKERRRVETEKKTEAQQVVVSSELKSNKSAVISPTTSGLPEFHIAVFKDLAAADAFIREAAANSLVAELLEVQKAYDILENKEVVEGQLKLEAEKDDGLNNCAPSLRYAVRRLIRGISSSRECARQGFALGMTVLVGAVPCIKVDALLKLIVELLEISSSMKGQDMKDCLLGRLFAYGSIARSGRLTLEWTADKNTPYIKEFVGSLVWLAKKKLYLQEPAVSIILELVDKERSLGPGIAKNKLHSMRYLLIQLLLQVLLRPQEFSEAASELVICCTKAFRSSDLLASSGDDEAEGDDSPEFMDVLVDTMLSLLPQSSAPMRTAIEQVFKCFCEDVTDDGLHRMLRVIKKDLKPARHQETDSENEDDDDDDVLDIEEAEESDEAEMDETAERHAHVDDSETVVGVEGVTSELPVASDDDSDEGLDDDAMFRLDTHLAKMYNAKKNQAGSETAHSQLALFKLRVLSLLEIYLHENPEKPKVVKIFSSLAHAFVNPHTTEGNEQLGQRIWGILQKKIFKAKDYPKGEVIEFPVLKSLLERNLVLAAKHFKKKKSASSLSKKKLSAALNRFKMINSLAQSSIFWILKIIDTKKRPKSELEEVSCIFREKLEGYLDSKSTRMKCEFLKEVFKRRPRIGYPLFGFLLEKCASAKLQFRQIEALELVIEMLKSFVSSNPDDNSHFAELGSHLAKLGCLVNVLLKNMPDKASRRADVRKFFGKVIQVLTDVELRALFLKALEPDCEAQLKGMFPVLNQ